MTPMRRRAIWLAFALAGTLAVAGITGTGWASQQAAVDAGRSVATHAVVDHDVAATIRTVSDRTPLDLRQGPLLLLLGWIGAVVAARRARGLGLALRVGSRSAGPAVPAWRRFDRGPPAFAASA